MNVGSTQELTATLKDAADHTLTGRDVSWVSSNIAVLTVSPPSGTTGTTTVTAVGAGTATITATSESVSSSPTPTITVNQQVVSVTLSTPITSMAVGGTQVLTAMPRDNVGNVLSGRTVNWVSSDPTKLALSAASSISSSSGATITITAIEAGNAAITAMSEAAPSATTSTIAISPALAAGPLRVSTDNRRYFADPAGHAVYLTGSEYWKTIQDNSPSNPPQTFDYSAFLDFLQSHNHNFTRLYMWEQARWSAETSDSHWFSPTPYLRPGPGTAIDGEPKFDVTQLNPAYFARVRQRVIDAGARGIYVSVMLFNGWSLGTKGGSTVGNPWLAHPFNAANNINGIDGDPNGDDHGFETQTLSNSAITALQEAYVRAVVDAVNDLDNVIYEISNESEQSADAWQYHMIDVIRSYEATKPKQHPIGMTVPYPTTPPGTNVDVMSSSADWVSRNGDVDAPDVADGSKVSLLDTDHVCGICGDPSWPWKSMMQGHNPLLMDGYDGSAGVGDPDYNPSDPVWNFIRDYMGYARSFALRMDVAHAVPHPELSSDHYCLAVPGSEYLVLLPTGGSVDVNLSAVSGTRTVEWYQPRTQSTIIGTSVSGGSTVTLTSPFSGSNLTVLYIHP